MEEIYKGYTIKIVHDDDAESPREWDNLGTMVCWHRQYNLGDIHNYKDAQEFLQAHDTKKNFILPLFLYNHSGITIKTTPFNDNWDSGQVGYIYCSVEKAKKEFTNRKDWKSLKGHIYKILESEVKIYDQFLTGDIWGYVIDNKGGEDAFDMNSCWGFYGQEAALTEAKSLVDWHVEHAPRAKNKSILTRGAYK